MNNFLIDQYGTIIPFKNISPENLFEALCSSDPIEMGGSMLLNGKGYMIWGPGGGYGQNPVGRRLRQHCTAQGHDFLYGPCAILSLELVQELHILELIPLD